MVKLPRPFHVKVGFACLFPIFVPSCERDRGNPSVAPQATTEHASVPEREAREDLKPRHEYSLDPGSYPIFNGVGKRVIDPDSPEFARIVEKVLSLKDGHLHEVRFAVELEEGSIEVSTRKIGESMGWIIVLNLEEGGGVTIITHSVWET